MTNPVTPRFISENNLDLDTIKINTENDIFVDPAAIVDDATIVVNANNKLESAFAVTNLVEAGNLIATIDTGAASIEVKENITSFAAEFNQDTGKLLLTHTNEDDSQQPIEINLTNVSLANQLTEGHKIFDLTINGETTDFFESVTTLVEEGRGYKLTTEDGTETFVAPTHFISTDENNAIVAGLDDGLSSRMATDTESGVVVLAVADNFPSTSDVEVTTAAYVQAAIANQGNIEEGENVTITGVGTTEDPTVISVPDATDVVKGVVSLAVADNFPSTSDVEAVTPSYIALLVEELTKDVFDGPSLLPELN